MEVKNCMEPSGMKMGLGLVGVNTMVPNGGNIMNVQ